MKTAQLFFPGEFDDCFLYRGKLVAFTQNQSIKFIDLKRVTNYLELYNPGSIPLPSMMFRSNDWLLSPLYQSAIGNPEFAKAILNAFSQLPSGEIDYSKFVESEQSLDADIWMLLDCNIYNSRIYLAGDSGFYHSQAEWGDGVQLGKFQKRHDGKVIDTSAKAGTINISCGTDGLFSSVNEFGLNSKVPLGFKHKASCSMRSDWCKYELVNYPEVSRPQIFQTKTVATGAGLEYEKKMLTDVSTDNARGLEHMPRSSDNPRTFIDWTGVDYMFNTNQLFFAHQSNGDLYRIRVTYPKDSDSPRVSSIGKVKEFSAGKILSTNPLGASSVVETFDKVSLLHAHGVTTLLNEPVLSVRTYPGSKYYKRLVTLVSEKGIWLMSVFDEAALEKRIASQLSPEELTQAKDQSSESGLEQNGTNQS